MKNELLRQLCNECIAHSDADGLKAAISSGENETALLYSQISAHLLYRVLAPAAQKVFPETDVLHDMALHVSDADVMAEIFADDIDIREAGFKALVEGVTRNRLRAKYLLQRLEAQV